MKNRYFTYKGIQFHLNDNGRHNEFEGKYILLFWNEGRERWQQIINCNTKKEALNYVKRNYLYI